MAVDTWHLRELVILEAVRDAWEGGDEQINNEKLVELTRLDAGEVARSLGALLDAEYVGGTDTSSFGEENRPQLLGVHLLERGRRAVGQWPSEDSYDALIDLLDRRLAETSDEETAGKLRSLRDTVADVGKGVTTSVLAAYLKGQLGV